MPYKKRKYTDVYCTVAFSIIIGVASAFQLYALIEGKFSEIEADYDGNGMFCGVERG